MLTGFGVSGYRSFGPDPQFIEPLAKINIFAGQNNSGKSNILRLVSILEKFRQNPLVHPRPSPLVLGELDRHRGKRDAHPLIYLPLNNCAESIEAVIPENRPDLYSVLREILNLFPHQTTNAAWFEYSLLHPPRILSPTVELLASRAQDNSPKVSVQQWSNIWNVLFRSQGGGLKEHHIPETLDFLSPLKNLPMPTVAPMLEAHRQIGDADSVHEGLSGAGVIKKLAELERPDWGNEKDKERFAKISRFVQSVTGYSDARLEVPSKKPELLVYMGGKLLKIESLGTGIHQVILFAVAATITENSIMCIL